MKCNPMKCPYCGKDMEAGMIESSNKLQWKRADARGLLFQEGTVTLSKFSLSGSAVLAYLCTDCQKIIIDCSDLRTDLNYKEKHKPIK